MANISSDAVRSLISYLVINGISRSECLDKIKMTDAQLLKRPMVNFKTYLDLYDFSVNKLKNHALGFDYGQHIDASRWGVLGQIAFTSRNLHQALNSQRQYQSIAGSLGTPSFVSADHMITLIWQENEQYNNHVAEEILTSWVALARLVTGEHLVPTKVWFKHSANKHINYQSFFGCDVDFNELTCGLTITNNILSFPCASFNPELNRVLRQYADQLVAEHALASVVDVASDFIMSKLPAETPTIEQLAEYLTLSSRTLQRKLSQSQTSFSKLLDQAKRKIAIDYVTNTQMAFEQLSHLLNFSEQSAFNRAFKRWTKLSPANYRKQHQILHF